jgi:phenylacetate-CoA ligase
MLEHGRTLLRRWRPRPGDRDALAAFQQRKLGAIVAHCRAHVAIYRDHWSGVDTTSRSIQAFPTIGKDDFRARDTRDTLADGSDPRGLVTHSTSGSSGQPFAIYRSRFEEHLLQAFRFRAESACGVKRTDRIVRFQQPHAGGFAPSWARHLRHALGFFRDERLDGLADASTMVAEIAHRRPDVVHAYPSILSAIADEIVRTGKRDLGLRLLTCGGETLDPSGRRKLEDAFRVPIADLYGAHEFNLVAWQCPAGHGFHVCDDNVVVEILGEDGAPVPVGATGEVVVTGLHGYTMPFVRYRLGDLAVRGPDACPCGAPWSTLSAIQGRTGDILRLPGGRRVHPYLVTGSLADHDRDWISRHQLAQTDEGRVLLSLAVRRPPTREEVARVRAVGERVLGPDVRFDVAIVDGFARTPGAKFRPYVPPVG